ncbi:SEL1-like repeat protein [Thalassobaculum salexigens]|uniref:SEL1-like repeat protein n=1 Tax=Thalassobaculum salexigens TaxID=455360 RepID=UPI0012ECA085|nr:SEL1-like repeat protein [Thalassobaculum salexigens]
MSRDATAWSVKGVDQATRDIARRAAAASGMTIGEWIDHAIKSDSANRGIPVPAGRDGAPGAAAPQRVDGISADTVEAIFSRISDGERLFEARLRPIGYALKDVAERVVALEREAERLPPPGAPREFAPSEIAADPGPTSPEAGPAESAPAESAPAESAPAAPVRTPIAFRPIRTPEPPAEPPAPVSDDPVAEDPVSGDSASASEDDVWDSEPQETAPPERPRPTPIAFRPIPPPPIEPSEEHDDFEPIERNVKPVPAPPPGPPEDWSPDFELDRAALADAADEVRDRPRETSDQEPERPDLDAATAAVETWEPTEQTAPDDIPAPPAPESEVVSKPQRPDPTPPAYDFPADPIDTSALGLSGEPIPEPLPPRRLASRGRLAIAAALVLALLGGAAWTAHRQGTLSLGAVGARLAEAETSVHLALVEATDWVMHLVGSDPHVPQDGVESHPQPAPPPETVASAPPAEPASPAAATPPAGTDSQAGKPATEPAPAETAAVTPPEPAVQPAPPLPEKPIDVDPRPVAPPPAPALSEPPRRASAAAAPVTQGTAPLSRAEAGNPAAQFEVAAGMMRAAEPRPGEAATWFREAAINGLDVAQFNLGVMYERGLGVPEDETRALLWYHSAAEQGYSLAQYNLGRLYALGKGIPQSDAEAKRWFQRAADRGVSAGLYELARFETDELERERKMYTAAKAGAEAAQEWLRVKSAGGVPEAPLGPPAGLMLDTPTGAPDIAEIQEGLSALGYYDGPMDGIAGPMTRAAISKFQSDNGLPATGLPSRSLRQRLN